MCSSYLLSWGSQQCNPHLLHASKDFLAPLPGNERKQQHIIVPRQLTTSKIFWRRCTHQDFLAPLPGRKITSARGFSHSQSFYFVIVFSFLFLFVAFYQKSKKHLLYIFVIFTAYFIPVIMTPEEMIFTFKQGSEESFKEAWSRINESYDKTEPKMTLGLLLTSFYFGLVLRYRYGLKTLVVGDFLQSDGYQAFNAIKILITIYSIPNSFGSSIASIYARMNTLESNMNFLKECYNQLREKVDYVPINSESSGYLSTIKVTIDEKIFDARCDIMSEFCLMPKEIYESFNLWGLSEGGEKVSLTNNSVILPIGIAEGVFTKNLGRTVSTDYLVIECVGK